MHQFLLCDKILVNINMDIPHHISQTWETYDVPPVWSECIPSIKEQMPHWKHSLHSAADRRLFVQKYFTPFLDKFDAYPYNVQRADAWRYLYLYINGGIYMDLDYIVKRPLDQLLANLPEADLYVVYSGNVGKVITNSFIVAKPYCPIFLDIYQELYKDKPWWAIGRHLEVMTTTGPILFNRIVKKYRRHPELGVKVHFIPRDKFYVCSSCQDRCDVNESYVKGLPGQSWATWDTAFFNAWRCHWPWLTTLVILVVILLVLFIYFLFHA